MSSEDKKIGKAPIYYSEFDQEDCGSHHAINGTPWCSHPIVVNEYRFGRLNDLGQRILRSMRSCRGCEYFGSVL